MADETGNARVEADHIDGLGLGQHLDGAVEVKGIDALAQTGDRCFGGSAEAVEDGAGLRGRKAFGGEGHAFAEPLAEHLLQVREAPVAQNLGKAHQRRGLHLGLAGNRGDGAEGHLVGVIERVGGGLDEALRQGGRALGEEGAEALEVPRRAHRGLAKGSKTGAKSEQKGANSEPKVEVRPRQNRASRRCRQWQLTC